MSRTIIVTRYVTPLREGGSMPGLVEADDDGLYVLKFRGAGQGPKALIAEWIAGEIGRALELPVPEVVFAQLDSSLGRNEPDYEIRSLIMASDGLNLALDFLPGALPYIAGISPAVDPALASAIVWFDAYMTNIDRTARNTNMLLWHRKLWLIDHGASLYFHHNWENYQERSHTPFAAIKDHVLLRFASQIAEADARLRPLITSETLGAIVAAIPDSWLERESAFATNDEHRAAYMEYLLSRLHASQRFVEEAINAHTKLI